MGFTWLSEFSTNIILVFVLCYGGHLVKNGRITTEGIISFLLYQVQLGENFYVMNFILIFN